FAKYVYMALSVQFRTRHNRIGVLVEVENMSDIIKVSAAGCVDESRGIVLHGPLGNLAGLELGPRFVERHPHDDAGEIVGGIDNCLPLGAENFFGLGGAFLLDRKSTRLNSS